MVIIKEAGTGVEQLGAEVVTNNDVAGSTARSPGGYLPPPRFS